jgi:hypothetical protein
MPFTVCIALFYLFGNVKAKGFSEHYDKTDDFMVPRDARNDIRYVILASLPHFQDIRSLSRRYDNDRTRVGYLVARFAGNKKPLLIELGFRFQ